MDFITIKENLFPFIIISIFIVVTGIVYYFLKRTKKATSPSFFKHFVILLLICWGITVIGLTMFGRNTYPHNQINLKPFSGYFNAWNTWNIHELQMIIFNVLMFVPLGFLLPLLSPKTRKATNVFLISFGITLFIETVQLLTNRGIFELDDLFHNTVGSMMGYFLIDLFLHWREEKIWKKKKLIKAFMIPFGFAATFILCMLVYHYQEFGNLPMISAVKQDMEGIKVSLKTELSSQKKSVSIYQNIHSYDKKYSKEVVSLFAKEFDLTQEKTVRQSGHNHYFYFQKGNEKYYLLYHDRFGTWSFNNRKQVLDNKQEPNFEAEKEKWESWLQKNHLLNGDATYTLENSLLLTWTLSGKSLTTQNQPFTMGTIQINLSNQEIPYQILSTMTTNRYVKKKQIISEEEAYQELLHGNFAFNNRLKKKDKLVIVSCQLEYVSDTKGYLQPVYQFNGYINQQNDSITIYIPAL